MFLWVLLGIYMILYVVGAAMPPTYYCNYYYCYSVPNPAGQALTWTASSLGSVYSLVTLVLLCRARAIMRKKDEIPESCCHGDCCCNASLDDCCCVFWCAPCITCQMLRHTTNRNYLLCSKTGNLDGDMEAGMLAGGQ